MLPDRIHPILDRLDRLLDRDADARAHIERGKSVYLRGVATRGLPHIIHALGREFGRFDYRDERGRNAIDLCIENAEPDLSPDERDVLAEIARSRRGIFEVLTCDPGARMWVRRIEGEERLEVVEPIGPWTFLPGEFLTGRLVPYRERYELVGETFGVPNVVVSILRSSIRAGDSSLLPPIEDGRLWLRPFVPPAEEKEPPPAEEVAGAPPPATPPPESEWPAADRPLWPRERILPLLADPSPLLRRWALEKVEYEFDPEIEARIGPLLRDRDHDVRLCAMKWARRWGTAAMAGAALDVLAERDPEQASRLADVAVRWVPEKAVPFIWMHLSRIRTRADDPTGALNLAPVLLDLCRALGRAGGRATAGMLFREGRRVSPLRWLAASAGLYAHSPERFLTATLLAARALRDPRISTDECAHDWEVLIGKKAEPWSSWGHLLEIEPGRGLEDDLDAFGASAFAKLLRLQVVSDPMPFARLLSTEEYGRIRQCWNKRELVSDAISSLARAIERALERSEGRASAGFATLALRIRALAAALRACAPDLAAMPTLAIRPFLMHVVAVLIKACHGRLFAAEVDATRHSLDGLLALNEIDLPMPDDLPQAIAAFGGAAAAGEMIARVERGGDDHPTLRAMKAIALLARDPALDRERAAAAVTRHLHSDWLHIHVALEKALPRLGDPVLSHILRVSKAEDEPGLTFTDTAASIGTERALFLVERLLPRIRIHVRPNHLAAYLARFAHPSLNPVLDDLDREDPENPSIRVSLETVRLLCGAVPVRSEDS